MNFDEVKKTIINIQKLNAENLSIEHLIGTKVKLTKKAQNWYKNNIKDYTDDDKELKSWMEIIQTNLSGEIFKINSINWCSIDISVKFTNGIESIFRIEDVELANHQIFMDNCK